MSFAFYLISAISVAGGLAAVLLKNTVHCALALTVVFAGLALLFLQLDAQFAGFAQILVYIGAVAILVVFAILLTKGSETPKDGVFGENLACRTCRCCCRIRRLWLGRSAKWVGASASDCHAASHRCTNWNRLDGPLRFALGDCCVVVDRRINWRSDNRNAR